MNFMDCLTRMCQQNFALRALFIPFARQLAAFTVFMQADLNHEHLGAATGRVPPSWNLENEAKYPLRYWRQDLEVWAASTDLPEIRHGPCTALRISGVAKLVVREIPTETLVNGGIIIDDQGAQVQLSGLGMLIRILEKRYGAAPQEVQVHSISELFQFSRSSNESTDSVIARFEILLHRAEGIGGVLFAPQLKAWMLLTFEATEGLMVHLVGTNSWHVANQSS